MQGAANRKIILHHKIEKLIVDSKISSTFLRPVYFMQNFTTTLRDDSVINKTYNKILETSNSPALVGVAIKNAISKNLKYFKLFKDLQTADSVKKNALY